MVILEIALLTLKFLPQLKSINTLHKRNKIVYLVFHKFFHSIFFCHHRFPFSLFVLSPLLFLQPQFPEDDCLFLQRFPPRHVTLIQLQYLPAPVRLFFFFSFSSRSVSSLFFFSFFLSFFLSFFFHSFNHIFRIIFQLTFEDFNLYFKKISRF